MKKFLHITIPLVLVVAILLCTAWYLFVYDQEFTRDMLLYGARYFEGNQNHSVATWFYDLAYRQAGNNDAVAIELAQQHKAYGNYTQAEFVLSSAITDGGSTELYIALCQTYVEQDKVLDAVKLLDAVCQESSTVDATVRQELTALRPAAPTAEPDPGFYSQYISVSISAESGTLYVNANGEFPSVNEPAYTQPVTLADGENSIYAVALSENGLVSPLSIFGYTVGGVIEEITFADTAVEAEIRSLLQVSADKTLYTNDLWTIKEFTVPEGAQKLDDLCHMIFLQKLTIDNGVSGQLASISTLSNLETLIITDTAVQAEELPVIGSLSKLQSLTLQNCGLSTSAGLEKAVNLRYLDLSENTIRNIDALSEMINLQELNLQNNHAVTDLSKLSSLRALTRLDVSGNMLTTLSPITGLTGLTYIDASENAITELAKIDQLTMLTYLSVAANELTDVSVLGGCLQLSELDISDNKLTDISALSALQVLTRLNFTNNQVTSLPKWSAGCALITIDGSQNQLTSLEPLRGLSHLNNVYMDYNAEISSVACLADCPLLIQVNVYGTNVTSVSMLTEMSVVVNYNPTN